MNCSTPGLPVHHQLPEFTQTHVHRVGDAIQPSHPRFSFCSVQSLSRVRLFLSPWTAAGQAPLSSTISWSWLKFMSTEQMMLSNHLILCCPLLLLPSVFPSIRVFSSESGVRIRWPKYWSFSISPSNEHSGLISFRMDWLDLLAVQWILKSLLQHHSSKASILWHSALFRVQLSHPYMTTGKTIALTRRTFVGKILSLGFFYSIIMNPWIYMQLMSFSLLQLLSFWSSNLSHLWPVGTSVSWLLHPFDISLHNLWMLPHQLVWQLY